MFSRKLNREMEDNQNFVPKDKDSNKSVKINLWYYFLLFC